MHQSDIFLLNIIQQHFLSAFISISIFISFTGRIVIFSLTLNLILFDSFKFSFEGTDFIVFPFSVSLLRLLLILSSEIIS